MFVECLAMGRRLTAITARGTMIIDVATASTTDSEWTWASNLVPTITTAVNIAKGLLREFSTTIEMKKLGAIVKDHADPPAFFTRTRDALSDAYDAVNVSVLPVVRMQTARNQDAKSVNHQKLTKLKIKPEPT